MSVKKLGIKGSVVFRQCIYQPHFWAQFNVHTREGRNCIFWPPREARQRDATPLVIPRRRCSWNNKFLMHVLILAMTPPLVPLSISPNVLRNDFSAGIPNLPKRFARYRHYSERRGFPRTDIRCARAPIM